jgi:hypothetical protein
LGNRRIRRLKFDDGGEEFAGVGLPTPDVSAVDGGRGINYSNPSTRCLTALSGWLVGRADTYDSTLKGHNRIGMVVKLHP